MLKNTNTNYGVITKNFHWLMALVIVINFSIGFIMGDLERGPLRFFLFNLHKSFGILILFFIFLRLFWRFMNVVPDPLQENKLLKFTAKSVHYFFYAAIIILTFSGWAYSSARGASVSFFGLFSLPPLVEKSDANSDLAFSIHSNIGLILVGLFVIHVGASLYHHYIKKDQTLKRMWFKKSE